METPLLFALMLADPQAVTAAEPVIAQAQPVVSTSQPAQAPPEQDGALQPADPAQPADQETIPPAEGENVIIVEGQSGPPPGDPLIQINEAMATAVLAVDDALVEPIADAYRDELPKPARNGLRNFFRNLKEPINFLNFLLQLKPLAALETLGRFVVNSTVGVAGLFDVAGEEDGINLPYRQNGFANTLGYYGVGPGPYLVLPLIGATTLRDLIGGVLDTAVLPFAVGKPFNTPYYAVPSYVVNSLQARIEFDEELERIKSSDWPYDELKEHYLERREREINALRGIEPVPEAQDVPAAMPAEAPAAQPPALPVSEPATTGAEQPAMQPAG